ncbi:hypothetical protein ACFZC3_15510 [Streptomyces sp. NPDC007903]|uniref:hypothetical protein n=1 Tax=Streptomyces sp. NPDC007903 TaxID=3364786 RepID=UPI0036DFC527
MATLTMNVVPHAGLRTDTLLVPASAGGDSCATGQGVFLRVKNADAASHTLTFPFAQTVDGQAVTPRTVTVPAGASWDIPVLDLYANPSTGLASWTYDAVTSVTVAAIRISS